MTLWPFLLLLTLTGTAPALAQPSPPPDAAMSGAAAAPPSGGKDDTLNFSLETSIDLRDPFRRFIPSGGLAETTTPELERYELEKLTLIGIITGPRNPKAMVTVPSGKMHIVKVGDHIGNRRGVVTKILPGMITVVEKVINLLGQEEPDERILEFKPSTSTTAKASGNEAATSALDYRIEEKKDGL